MSERSAYCTKCGRFVGNVKAKMKWVQAEYVGGEAIDVVEGDCKRCGRVEAGIPLGWCWEDFDHPPAEETP